MADEVSLEIVEESTVNLKIVEETPISLSISEENSDQLVKVSADDNQASYLSNKLVAGTGIELEIINPGANETYKITNTGEANTFVGGNGIDITESPDDTFTFEVVESEISHLNISDIGINTHSEIDSHISDDTIHFTQAQISITESQISDLDKYSQSEVDNLLALKWNNNGTSTATDDWNIGEYDFAATELTSDLLNLRTDYKVTGSEPTGTSYWDSDNNTVSTVLTNGVILQNGQETMLYAKNTSGAVISNGQAVSVSNVGGSFTTIELTDATDESCSKRFIGLATQDIANNAFGYVTLTGITRGLNTNSWTEGETLFVDETSPGDLTMSEPSPENYTIRAGIVEYKHINNGRITVLPTIRLKLQDLSGVNGTPLTTNGQILVWDNDNNYFDFSSNINDYYLSADFNTDFDTRLATKDITDLGTYSHTSLTDIGTNTHAQIDTFIGTTVPATYVPYTGATTDVDLGANDLTAGSKISLTTVDETLDVTSEGLQYLSLGILGIRSRGSIYNFIDSNNNGTDAEFGIYKNGSTSSENTLFKVNENGTTQIQNDGTSSGLFIDQNGNGRGLFIQSDATSSTNYALEVSTQGANAYAAKISYDTSKNYCIFGKTGASATGSYEFFRDLTSASTGGPVVFIEQDNAGDDQNALNIQNDGTGTGLFIDQNGNASALRIYGSATTTNDIYIESNNDGTAGEWYSDSIRIMQNGNGGAMYIRRNSEFANTPLVTFNQEHSLDTSSVVKIKNDGVGRGIYIDQNGNGIALDIDSEATTNRVLNIVMDAATTSRGVAINSNSASHSGNLLYLNEDNVSATATVFELKNDGTGKGLFIDQNGDGIGLFIDSEATGTSQSLVVQGKGSSQIVNFRSDSAATLLTLDQNENGTAFRIDSEATTGDTIDVDAATTTGDVLDIYAPTLTTGRAMQIYSDSALLSNVLAKFTSNNSSSTGKVIEIINAGTGKGLFIDQNGNGVALNITNAGTEESIRCQGNIFLTDDNDKLLLGAGKDMSAYYTGTVGVIDTSEVAPSDLQIACGTDKTLELQEPVWDDIQFVVESGKTSAVNAPTWDDLTTNTGAYKFDVDDYIDLGAQEMKHDWIEDSSIYPHLHVALDGANASGSSQYAKFTIYLAYADESGVFTETSKDIEIEIPTGTADRTHLFGNSVSVDLSGFTIGTQINARVKRITATTGTEYPNDVFITQVGIHYEITTMGSRQIGTK